MLNSVLKDAIKKRDETLSILKGPKFEQIVKEAKSNWTDFSPTKQDVVAAGIDSSFNSTKYIKIIGQYLHDPMPGLIDAAQIYCFHRLDVPPF